MEKSTPTSPAPVSFLKKDSILSNLSVQSQRFVKHNLHDFERDYQVEEKIGEGSYGGVFKITHRALGLKRALKIITKTHKPKQPIPKEEIDALVKLDHPNIIKIYEYYESKDLYFIVIEFFEGRELFDELCEQDVFNESKAAYVSAEILKALAYTHKCKVVHRDIKAENIMIRTQGDKSWIKIIDWGLGTWLNPKGLESTIGTPEYIAPEVISGKYDEKCDIWGFGVILHTMLSGIMPFMGDTSRETMELVKRKRISFADDEWKNISMEGKELVSKLLERNPARRLSAESALNHPWFKKFLVPKVQPLELRSTLVKLKELQLQTHLHTAAHSFINNHLSAAEDKRQLDEIFFYLDTNHNGLIEYDELLTGYKSLYGNSVGALIAEQVFKKLDYNHSGTIQYNEFITYAMLKRKEIPKNKLEQAFKLFDTNKDGAISTEELKTILSNGIEDVKQEEWDQIINTIDTNQDGEINKCQFFQCMTNISEYCATLLSKSRSEGPQIPARKPNIPRPSTPARRSLRVRKLEPPTDNISEVVKIQASLELDRLI